MHIIQLKIKKANQNVGEKYATRLESVKVSGRPPLSGCDSHSHAMGGPLTVSEACIFRNGWIFGKFLKRGSFPIPKKIVVIFCITIGGVISNLKIFVANILEFE